MCHFELMVCLVTSGVSIFHETKMVCNVYRVKEHVQTADCVIFYFVTVVHQVDSPTPHNIGFFHQ